MIDYIPLSINSYWEFASTTALGSLELPSDSPPTVQRRCTTQTGSKRRGMPWESAALTPSAQRRLYTPKFSTPCYKHTDYNKKQNAERYDIHWLNSLNRKKKCKTDARIFRRITPPFSCKRLASAQLHWKKENASLWSCDFKVCGCTSCS